MWATDRQKHYLRDLLLKIKTKKEWTNYFIVVNEKKYYPFRSNNTIWGGLLFDDAKILINAILHNNFEIKKYKLEDN